ncbi:hypothetical protein EIP86_004565 [Pleurotus ostreatoroseus]|nr:hypothetical protein EIP86_004565 [Pleurotus ostreatoroseus]
MAKPKSATDLASSATSSSRSKITKRAHRRRRTSSSSPHSTLLAPSSALLASLATIVASCSSADGRPLAQDSQPPDFLCPFLPLDVPEVRPAPSRRDDLSEDAYYLSPTPTRTKRRRQRRASIADKYVQGPDGRWRKEQTWSLYGSTYCECTGDGSSSSSETGVPEVDDQVNPSDLASSSAAQSTGTDMSGSLPSGWSDARSSRESFTSIILALSLLLALIICCLIGGLVWRRKRRASQRKDVENKEKSYPYFDDETEVEEIKRFRSHQKIWSKATARWKSNVRLSIRRRRKRPHSVAPSQDIPHEPSTLSLPSQYSYTADPAVRDDRSECSSVADDDTVDPAPEPISPAAERSRTDGETQDADSASQVPPDPSRPAQPPEYPLDGALPGGQHGRLGQAAERLDGTEAQAPSPDRTSTTSPPALSVHDRPPYTAPANSAHLATDDKALLERMVDLASHPPVEGSSRGSDHLAGSSPPSGPSVPIMDEFEELPEDILVVDEDGPSGSQLDWRPSIPPSSSLSIRIPVPSYSREPSPHPPLFPAPPTKAQLAAPTFYDYPSTFEGEGAADELETPSAPPFDFGAAGPSAPPLEGDSVDMDACACAPPLIDEEEEIQLGFIAAPSAPPAPEETTDGSSGPVSSSEAGPSTGLSPPSRRHSAPFSPRTASPPDYLP